MRRRFWPYAILAVTLSLIGLLSIAFLVMGRGAERAGAQLAAANALVVEPVMNFLVSTLEAIAPFDLPVWLKQTYAVLGMIALAGIPLSLVVGLLLLPVFYALYRGGRPD